MGHLIKGVGHVIAFVANEYKGSVLVAWGQAPCVKRCLNIWRKANFRFFVWLSRNLILLLRAF